MRLRVVGLRPVAITLASSARAKDLADGKIAGELWEGNEPPNEIPLVSCGDIHDGSLASEPERQRDEGPVTVKLTPPGSGCRSTRSRRGEWQSLMVTTITDQKTKAGTSDLYGEG